MSLGGATTPGGMGNAQMQAMAGPGGLTPPPGGWPNTGGGSSQTWTTPGWAGSPGGTTKALSGPFGSVPAQSWDATAAMPSQSFTYNTPASWAGGPTPAQKASFLAGVPTPPAAQYASPNYQLPTTGLGAAGQQIAGGTPQQQAMATLLGRIAPGVMNHLMTQSYNPLPGNWGQAAAAGTPAAAATPTVPAAAPFTPGGTYGGP